MLNILDILGAFNKYITEILNDPLLPFYFLAGFFVFLALKILDKMNFKDLLSRVDDWMIAEKKNKGAFKFFIFLTILGFCFAGCFVIFFITALVPSQKVYSSALNEYFSIKYDKEIKPQSEIEINQIVKEANSISNLSEKLERIAEWETQNFTDIYWHHSIVKSINPYADSYTYDTSGKIRATRSYVATPYAEDPYWITYYRFGACGEESSLFANISNRTGIVTRPIVLDLGYWIKDIIPVQTGNHAFLEVQVNDNEWYYFDPTIYGADHFLNESACKNGNPCENRWFRKTEEYNYFGSDQVLRIYRGDTKEDVSDRYPKLAGSIQKSKNFYAKKEPVNVTQNATLEIFHRFGQIMNKSTTCFNM